MSREYGTSIKRLELPLDDTRNAGEAIPSPMTSLKRLAMR
jgi:hypothetical protein